MKTIVVAALTTKSSAETPTKTRREVRLETICHTRGGQLTPGGSKINGCSHDVLLHFFPDNLPTQNSRVVLLNIAKDQTVPLKYVRTDLA